MLGYSLKGVSIWLVDSTYVNSARSRLINIILLFLIIIKFNTYIQIT